MKRVLMLAAALAALAALPAEAPAKITPPSPPPWCVNTSEGYICTTDIGPWVQRVASDPVGYACGTAIFTCGREA